jgi:pyruvate/2-oxoglutarate dehydrogenase complex dihydrolipoamide acyltransferase (E2) component
MSPTMTEGGVGTWKIKEGDAFSTGDVILEVVSNACSRPSVLMPLKETDKATMDIEAQDDGVMGKILVCRRDYSVFVD